MSQLIADAREFARQAHKTQFRKYTGEPYFVHLDEVAGLVEGAGLPAEAIAAAWLHDAIEDQNVSAETIGERFGERVKSLVVALTDVPPRPGINRKGRKALDRARLAKAPADAQSIKCADIISNTSSIVRYDPGFAPRYLAEIRAMFEVLRHADSALNSAAGESLRDAEGELRRRKAAPEHRSSQR